eukprot:9500649-Pyramimonas_sp.AAC.2
MGNPVWKHNEHISDLANPNANEAHSRGRLAIVTVGATTVEYIIVVDVAGARKPVAPSDTQSDEGTVHGMNPRGRARGQGACPPRASPLTL